ncbi:MAG TPA: T9SS type A sorting domain-containing protein, partial [bacterium]|nr:T9SS type A sorting domain-containing protein [bacterium]
NQYYPPTVETSAETMQGIADRVVGTGTFTATNQYTYQSVIGATYGSALQQLIELLPACYTDGPGPDARRQPSKNANVSATPTATETYTPNPNEKDVLKSGPDSLSWIRQMVVGPNPASGPAEVFLRTANIGTVKLKVYSMAGRLIEERTYAVTSPGVQSLDLDAGLLASGLYFVNASQASMNLGTFKWAVVHSR